MRRMRHHHGRLSGENQNTTMHSYFDLCNIVIVLSRYLSSPSFVPLSHEKTWKGSFVERRFGRLDGDDAQWHSSLRTRVDSTPEHGTMTEVESTSYGYNLEQSTIFYHSALSGLALARSGSPGSLRATPLRPLWLALWRPFLSRVLLSKTFTPESGWI